MSQLIAEEGQAVLFAHFLSHDHMLSNDILTLDTDLQFPDYLGGKLRTVKTSREDVVLAARG